MQTFGLYLDFFLRYSPKVCNIAVEAILCLDVYLLYRSFSNPLNLLLCQARNLSNIVNGVALGSSSFSHKSVFYHG